MDALGLDENRDQGHAVRPAYRSGAALRLSGRDPAAWHAQMAALWALPGLDHVELWIEEPGLEDREVAALREALGGRGVLLRAPSLQLSMISHHDLVRGATAEVYRRTLALADQLGAELVTFDGGTRPFLVDEGLALDQVAAMFAALRATGCRAEPTLKNLPVEGRRLVAYPAQLEELGRAMERMPDLRVTLDVGHCVRNRDNWVGFLRAQAGRIANVHLHDPRAGSTAPGGRLQRAPGGTDAFALARLLRAAGYAGYVTLTMEDEARPASWQLWQEAVDEASRETTATVEAGALRRA